MRVIPLLGFEFSVYLALIDCSGRIGLPSYLVGVVRENRVRGYFWGILHEGSSKIDKEKKGKEKDRRSLPRCESKRGVELISRQCLASALSLVFNILAHCLMQVPGKR